MAKDHYLPAALLGRFSPDSARPMRERNIWVYRNKQQSSTRTKAKDVGFRNNYYSLSAGQLGRLVDNTWTAYEQRLTTALDQLCDPAVNFVDGALWTRVLVPFVAGIFVRTPDFVLKHEGSQEEQAAQQPFLDVASISRSDNANLVRLPAMIRSLSLIMAARWTVLHTNGFEFLINNDLGYANGAFVDNPSRSGWVIPIGPKCALQLTPCPDGRSRRIMYHAGEDRGWRAFIDHAHLKPKSYLRLNLLTSRVAREFIVGPTQQSVEQQANHMGQDSGKTFTPQMRTSHRMQVVHEREWYRLIGAMRYTPEQDVSDRFAFDFSALIGDWAPPIAIFPKNFQGFTTGLKLRGRVIELAMSTVPGYTD
jgi:hypothetical protein